MLNKREFVTGTITGTIGAALATAAAQAQPAAPANGLNASTAARLAYLYEHGRELLKAKPAFNYIKLKDSNYNMAKGWDEIES